MSSKLSLIIAIVITILVGGLEVYMFNVTGDLSGTWLSIILIVFIWIIYFLQIKGIIFPDKSNPKNK